MSPPFKIGDWVRNVTNGNIYQVGGLDGAGIWLNVPGSDWGFDFDDFPADVWQLVRWVPV